MRKKLKNICLAVVCGTLLALSTSSALTVDVDHGSSVTKTSVKHTGDDFVFEENVDYNSHDHADASDPWTLIINLSDLQTAAATGGKYYLNAPVTVTEVVNVTADFSLCLNGYALTRYSEYDGVLFNISAEGTFTLYDCSSGETGTIDGNEDAFTEATESLVYAETGGATFNLFGGKLTNNTATTGGGVTIDQYSYMYIYGGSVTDNTATYGGGLYMITNSYVYMYAGEITYNVAPRGGGVASYSNARLYLYGGSISYNRTCVTKTESLSYYYGGGIYTTGYFYGYGGTISNNYSGGRGGGIYSYGHSIEIYENGTTISYNTSYYAGGGIYHRSLNLIIYGGEISYNSNEWGSNSISVDAHGGGGIYKYGGTLTITGGLITGNSNVRNLRGDNILVSSSVTANISGGEISNPTGSSSSISAAYSSRVYITGGYLGGDLDRFNNISTYGYFYVTGGYFTSSPSWVQSGYVTVNLDDEAYSSFDDDDYQSDFPYAVYRNASSLNSYSEFGNVTAKCGEDIILTTDSASYSLSELLNNNYSISYTAFGDDDTNYGAGAPNEAGSYYVTLNYDGSVYLDTENKVYYPADDSTLNFFLTIEHNKVARIDSYQAATCEENGFYIYTYECDGCDEVLSTSETVIIPASHGNTYTDTVVLTEATCVTNGESDTVTYCGVCGEDVNHATSTVEASGEHTYGSTYDMNDVGHYQTCTVCSTSTSLVAHNYGDTVTTSGTEENTEVQTQTCLTCGYVSTVNVVTEDESNTGGLIAAIIVGALAIVAAAVFVVVSAVSFKKRSN